MKVLVLFYYLYDHIFSLAKAVAEGVKKENVKVDVKRVEETLSDETLEKLGAKKHQEKMKNIPIATLQDLVEADAIIFGTPTRFGNMCAQMRTFLDSTGSLWIKGSLVIDILPRLKPTGFLGHHFPSFCFSDHYLRSFTLIATHAFSVLHSLHRLNIPSAPRLDLKRWKYINIFKTFKTRKKRRFHPTTKAVGFPASCHKIAGCSPYGASTICGPNGELTPNDVELNEAMFLGSDVAQITKKLNGIK
jgi:NAD(P)H dehydrogenase (quinone)